MKYGIFDKCIIAIDDDNIIQEITDINETTTYKRIRSARKKYICGNKIPDTYSYNLYDTPEILKKAHKLYDYTKDLENCGILTDYYYSGHIKQKFFHNKGIKDGIYYEYYENIYKNNNNNNNIKIECTYVNNILHGPYKKYYDNGKIEVVSNYNNNKVCGEYIYYPNKNDSTEYCKFFYIDNKKEGECIYEKNKSISTGKCKDNCIIELIEKDRLTNIILSQRYIDKENPDLIVIEINYESGKIKQKYTVTKDEKINGEFIEYFENGNISQYKQYFNHLIITNKTIEYYENGNIKSHVIENTNDNTYSYIMYYENQKISEKKIYDNNNIILYEKYNSNGWLIQYKYVGDGNLLHINSYNAINYKIDEKYISNKESLKKFALNLLQSLE